ncbi:hypothetical protein ACFL1Z_04500 [Thermodesulfobacteriota bacterium]
MRSKIRIFFPLFIVLIIFFFFDEAKTSEIEIKSGHPRLFITAPTLEIFKSRAATSHFNTYEDLKSWCDTNWSNPSTRRSVFVIGDRDYDAGVLRYALVYQLGTIDGHYYNHSINDYGDKAVETILDIVNSDDRKNIVYTAIAYDWVNERISTADKNMIATWFKSIAGETPNLRDRVGYRFAATPYCLYPGLALYGDGIDDNLAQTYINFIPTWLDDARCTSHESGYDGGHAAGLGYGKYVYGTYYHQGHDFYALKTATNLSIEDTFDVYPYMKGFATWMLYGIQPGGPTDSTSSNDVATVTKWEDCGSWHWNIQSEDYALMQTLRILAQVAKESGNLNEAKWITWLINKRLKAPKQNTTWDILFNDRNTVAISPDDLDINPVKAFGWDEDTGLIDNYMGNQKAGLGNVYMKSSWDPDFNTTHASFKAFPYYYFGHQHFDSLAFSIFKGEPLALPNSGAYFYWYEGNKIDYSESTGYPHQFYYYNRTVSKNSLLVLDPNEVIRMREEYYQSDQSFKDGGQRGLNDPGGQWGSVHEGPPTSEEIRKEGGGRDWGGLIRFEDTDSYTLSSGDATKGYNSIVDGNKYVCRGETDGTQANPKTELVQRDFLYLKSSGGADDYFVVFDRVVSTDPSFKKVFLLHTIGEPSLSGNESQIYGGIDGGIYESNDTNVFKISQTSAKLFMKTLLPTKTKVFKTGGYSDSILSSSINDTVGTVVGGDKIDITVADSSVFSDKPVVTIDTGSYKECFMCEGKDDNKNLLIDCIRGKRYYKLNLPQNHGSGSTVRQDYAWMVREVDTNDWISFPHDFGTPHNDSNKINDSDDYGRWSLRIETTKEETLSNFLHVLHPTTDMTKANMAETLLIDTGDMAGALIKDSSNQWVTIFSKSDSLQKSLAYNVGYSGSAKHLITGLEYAVYDIYKDGEIILNTISSKQKTLSFISDGGGVFQIAKIGEVPPDVPGEPANPKNLIIKK